MIRHRLAGAGLAFAATLTPCSPVALVNELVPTDDQLDHHRSLVGALAAPLRGRAPVLDDVAGFVAQSR